MTTQTQASAGISVTTEVEIADYWVLGMHLARDADNEQQLQLLEGLQYGFQVLGAGPRGLQLDAIRNEAEKKHISLRELLEFVKEIAEDPA